MTALQPIPTFCIHDLINDILPILLLLCNASPTEGV